MRKRTPSVLLALLAFFALAALARAHGGGTPQLVNEPLGPYWLSVWTQPDPPQVGELHVTAALARTDTGEPVTAPVIIVYARGVNKNDVIEAGMSHDDAATPYFYNTDFEVPYAGDWTIELVVKEGDWEGRASFPLTVAPAPIDKDQAALIASTVSSPLIMASAGQPSCGQRLPSISARSGAGCNCSTARFIASKLA